MQSVDAREKHCWKLTERACYDIGNFLVREGGEGVHQFIHNLITKNSTISLALQDNLPDRFFILNVVDDCNWNKFQIRCILTEDAFESTIALLDNLKEISGVFVVVQYALISHIIENGVELTTVLGATRVFLNPDFPEVAVVKTKVLGIKEDVV
ncbi:hypothetical protein QN277_011808 [Acacia crassicarpa]|uniref:Uncharacterized protein n=1 Tax=Acacia crassicarpa TaxID=499986 RepID=A0AAE1MZ87_9FABA|nr:hypothetical protein QN277_011808 [Acacia crassicarpa]